MQEPDSAHYGSDDASSSGIQVEEVVQTARQLTRQVCDWLIRPNWCMLLH